MTRIDRLADAADTAAKGPWPDRDLARAPVDIAALARSAVGDGQAAAGAKHVHLLLTGAAQVVAMADRDRLGQVLANLIGNALTYTPPGGRVVVDVAADDTACTVAVADTGIGLAPDDLGRVFDRFYRVEGVERPPGGSGIGLGIARAIARAHGGDVTAASDGPGHGATFTLHLPRRGGPGAAFTKA